MAHIKSQFQLFFYFFLFLMLGQEMLNSFTDVEYVIII